jgi:hypothetical protein
MHHHCAGHSPDCPKGKTPSKNEDDTKKEDFKEFARGPDYDQIRRDMESRAERLDRLLDDYKASRHVCSVNCCKYPCGSHCCTTECKNRSPSPCCRSSPAKCHSPYVPMAHRCSPSCCVSTCPVHFCSSECHCATCLCRECCHKRCIYEKHKCDEKCCVSNCTEHLMTCEGTRCWCFGCRCQKCLERIAGYGSSRQTPTPA